MRAALKIPLVQRTSGGILGSAGPWLALALAIAALLGLFWPTAASAVHQWHTASAYSYAFLIAPISVFLLWEDRAALRTLVPRPALSGLMAVTAFSFAWLVADELGINEGRHIALVGMIQGLCLAVLGWQIYAREAFALNYLWLMVPAGEFLVAPLQRIAHTGVVGLLNVVGTPVFTEGLDIQVPQATFVVEPGCAGLNFLLSALALSLIYGKLLYRSPGARWLCVVIALAAAVLANIVRIFLIIALTEWTDSRIGLADDHLLFGWGFFAIVMLALMWGGTKVASPPAPLGEAPVTGPPLMVPSRWSPVVALACLAVAALGPMASAATAGGAVPMGVRFALPRVYGPWRQTAGEERWSPITAPGDAADQATYTSSAFATADLSVTLYDVQREGHEAAAADNGPAAATWTVIKTTHRTVTIGGKEADVAATEVSRNGAQRSVLSWYESAGCITASRLKAKICAARARLRGQPADGAYVAISTEGELPDAAPSLADFASRLTHFAGPATLVPQKE